MMTGQQARRHSALLTMAGTGLAYDSEGDYSLSVAERRFAVTCAKAIRTGRLALRSIYALRGARAWIGTGGSETHLRAVLEVAATGRTLLAGRDYVVGVTVAEYQDKAQAQADNRRRVTCDACGAVVPYGETAADESGRGWLLCHTCQGVEQDLINAGGY